MLCLTWVLAVLLISSQSPCTTDGYQVRGAIGKSLFGKLMDIMYIIPGILMQVLPSTKYWWLIKAVLHSFLQTLVLVFSEKQLLADLHTCKILDEK